ncbi:MAG: methyltransferase domain-containing protein [Bifidobacteriaceae bacterium]|jgi:trans-aconitate methyltransferase|nr:methyltransferase domain-containing protein [Bifidobacteriaceae bacterium]
MKWDAQLYDSHHGFVAEYGKGLVNFVPAQARTVLDLGCGTGALTEKLANGIPGRHVLGVDSSAEMIEAARQEHPGLHFELADALNLDFDHEWDVVFSNAVFHWVPDHVKLLHSVHHALVGGGRGLLICEFGAHGNIATIEAALDEALLRETGVTRPRRFNFPTAATFSAELEECDFRVDDVREYDRPTPLSGGWDGLREWVLQFCETDFETLTVKQREAVVHSVEEQVKADLWDERRGQWVADYRRLRALAAAV